MAGLDWLMMALVALSVSLVTVAEDPMETKYGLPEVMATVTSKVSAPLLGTVLCAGLCDQLPGVNHEPSKVFHDELTLAADKA